MAKSKQRTAIIVGAGPAGLTAAYELLTRTDIKPIIVEASDMLGGIARTVNYKGNRIDIGGHRFFTKSDRVLNWWLQFLPLETNDDSYFAISYQGQTRQITNDSNNDRSPDDPRVMLVRERVSRIYYGGKLFNYPITLSFDTISNLGLYKLSKILVSYLRVKIFPLPAINNLEDFFVSRFGWELYQTFFQSYTEKVWGKTCRELSAEWGEQRVKGLSLTKTVWHSLQNLFNIKKNSKQTETSLIEKFLYPKFGPGQLWEEVGRQVVELGGEIVTNTKVIGLRQNAGRITHVTIADSSTNQERTVAGDYFFSTMPVKELILGLEPAAPTAITQLAAELEYRDFITVGFLLKNLKLGKNQIKDNWIYIHEPNVDVGRIQIFNNWSPGMIENSENYWIGMEYFCQEHDELWQLTDAEMSELAKRELIKLGFISADDTLDSKVIRMAKTYPSYTGSYQQFHQIRDYVSNFSNLFLIGRNGMHRYNNQDHSMLTAMVSVDNILEERTNKDNIWEVNTESEYHEETSSSKQ